MTGSLRCCAVGLAITLVLGACGSSEDGPLVADDQGASSVETTVAGSDEVVEAPTTSAGADAPAEESAGEAEEAPSGDVTVVATATSGVVVAYEAPDEAGAVVSEFDNPVETGGPLVFQVVDDSQEDWLQVMLPMRPNGTTGWVRASDVELAQTTYRIVVDVSDHKLQVFEGAEVVIDTAVGIGTGDTPTPYGEFYLYELLQPPDPSGPYGTYAFGLSGFSETLEEFNGGNGVIGIHGTNDPGSLGTDVSHGCIRVANEVIDEMAGVLPLGTPVQINA